MLVVAHEYVTRQLAEVDVQVAVNATSTGEGLPLMEFASGCAVIPTSQEGQSRAQSSFHLLMTAIARRLRDTQMEYNKDQKRRLQPNKVLLALDEVFDRLPPELGWRTYEKSIVSTG